MDAENEGEGDGTPYNSYAAGKYLKATSGWYDEGNGTDKYGFSALPGGFGYEDGSFIHAGNFGWWWDATEYWDGNSRAYARAMGCFNDDEDDCNYDEGAYWDDEKKFRLFSVRCVKD